MVKRIVYKSGDYVIFKRMIAGTNHWFLGYIVSIDANVVEKTSKYVITNADKVYENHKYYRVKYIDALSFAMNVPQYSRDFIYIDANYNTELEYMKPFIIQEGTRVHDIRYNATFTVTDITYNDVGGRSNYINFEKNDLRIDGAILEAVLDDNEFLIL